MRKSDGSWMKPPPDYPCISTAEATHNLDEFISMESSTSASRYKKFCDIKNVFRRRLFSRIILKRHILIFLEISFLINGNFLKINGRKIRWCKLFSWIFCKKLLFHSFYFTFFSFFRNKRNWTFPIVIKFFSWCLNYRLRKLRYLD